MKTTFRERKSKGRDQAPLPFPFRPFAVFDFAPALGNWPRVYMVCRLNKTPTSSFNTPFDVTGGCIYKLHRQLEQRRAFFQACYVCERKLFTFMQETPAVPIPYLSRYSQTVLRPTLAPAIDHTDTFKKEQEDRLISILSVL